MRSRSNTYAVQGFFRPKQLVKTGNQPEAIYFEYFLRFEVCDDISAVEFINNFRQPIQEMLRKDHPGYIIHNQDITVSTYFLLDSFENVSEAQEQHEELISKPEIDKKIAKELIEFYEGMKKLDALNNLEGKQKMASLLAMTVNDIIDVL